jgi:hypothetical protein
MVFTEAAVEELKKKCPFAEVYTDPKSEGFRAALKAPSLSSDPSRLPVMAFRPRSRCGRPRLDKK